MTRAIIVEDELDAQELLNQILMKYCPSIQVIGIASDIEEGVRLISDTNPQLVFLDIQLGNQTGFELLDQLEYREFKLIMTTAYQDYALEAFKYEAIDYILKPYSPQNIIAAVERVPKLMPNNEIYQKLDALLKQSSISNKISLPTADGIVLINTEEVIRLEADRAYSLLYLTNGQKEIISKSLKDIEALLPAHLFFRSHDSHLINLHQLQKYNKEDGGYALMSDQSQIPIARRRKNEFLEWIKLNGKNKKAS